MYDTIIKNGTLIDPGQQVNGKMDVAISNGKIEAVETKIESDAKHVIDAAGKIVTPGLVDLHTHDAYHLVRVCLDPDKVCLPKATTTAVDAGSTGELIYPGFRRFIIDRCRTRVLTFLNIESFGQMEYTAIDEKYKKSASEYTDQRWARLYTALDETFLPYFINLENTVERIRRNRDNIVGIKWAHHGPMGITLARKACDQAKCVLMTENAHMPGTLKQLRKGDIVTHAYLNVHEGIYSTSMVEDGKVLPEFHAAVKRGVLLDVGHGMGSFDWGVAEVAVKEGLAPNSISTDLWISSVNGPAYDMPTTMAKFLHLGMSLEDVIKASTIAPAMAIGKSKEFGTLRPGMVGDVAIFKLQEGNFPLEDCNRKYRKVRQKLIPTSVLRAGNLVN